MGDVFREAGFALTVTGPELVATMEPYDAVVIGSAVYAGHWLRIPRSR